MDEKFDKLQNKLEFEREFIRDIYDLLTNAEYIDGDVEKVNELIRKRNKKVEEYNLRVEQNNIQVEHQNGENKLKGDVKIKGQEAEVRLARRIAQRKKEKENGAAAQNGFMGFSRF